MEVVSVEFPSRYQQTSWFLKDFPALLGFRATIFILTIDVKAKSATKAYSTDNRMISGAIFVGHDSLSWEIFIDQDMIWCLVRAAGKYMRINILEQWDR